MSGAPRSGSELQDLVDDADYAASQSISASPALGVSFCHAQANRTDGESVAELETLFIKDNVAVHPTQNASQRINGRLRLIRQGSSVFVTWVPYTQTIADEGATDSAANDRLLYTIQDTPVAQIRSIRRHAPPLGWQYIIIVLTTGLAYPPLYFHNGGIKEFLTTLREHVHMVRSVEDANLFLVNDFTQDPLQRSLTSLELRDVVSTAALSTKEQHIMPSNGDEKLVESSFSRQPNVLSTNKDSYSQDKEDTLSNVDASNRNQHTRRRDPARDISIQVLEKFSLVTKFARDTTAQLFGESRMLGYGDGLEELSYLYEPRQREQPKPSLKDAATSQALGQVDNSFEIGPASAAGISDIQVEIAPRLPPLSTDEWVSYLDSEGCINKSQELRKRIFQGGIEPGLRREVWKFILGFFPYNSTYKERKELVIRKRAEYRILKAQWETISEEQARRFTKFRERKSRIEKDVVRTDRSIPFYANDDNPNITILRDILISYSFFNFDLGYCQGMSDLLSPILYIMEDESESFWCFASLMEHLAPNFHRDQNGMHSQLLAVSKLVQLLDNQLHNYFKEADCLNYFFCFRWILIQFKREFDYEDVIQLWERLWTNYVAEHLHLYLCVALLTKHKRKIMEEKMDFDTLLKFINELSGHIDLDEALQDAERLCIKAGDLGAACIPPGTPPSLQTAQSDGFY